MITAVQEEFMETLSEFVGFAPTGAEQTAILSSDGKFMIISGGEQAGKSYIAAYLGFQRVMDHITDLSDADLRAISTKDPHIYWLVGRKYENTEREFNYVVEWFNKVGVLTWASEADASKARRIELLGGKIVLKTLSTGQEMNIAKEAPFGIIGCESSQISLEGYKKLFLRANTRDEGWLILSGTYEKANGWWAQTFEQWKSGYDGRCSYILPSWTNTFLYPGGRTDPKILRVEAEDPEFFDERIAANPRKAAGLVFRDDFNSEWHVGLPNGDDVEYIPGLPVHLAIDYGHASAYAVEAVQVHPDTGQIRVFDEIYERKFTTEEIIDIALLKPWWKDVDPDTGVIDIGGIKYQQAVDPPVQVWADRARVYLKSKQVPIPEGISRFRSFLRLDPLTNAPKMIISPRCHGLLSELGVRPSPLTRQTAVYEWKLDASGNRTSKTPIDRNNHGIKALTYWLVWTYGFAEPLFRNKHMNFDPAFTQSEYATVRHW